MKRLKQIGLASAKTRKTSNNSEAAVAGEEGKHNTTDEKASTSSVSKVYAFKI